MSADAAIIAALLAGFFGSTHCIGMCGAIVTLLESPATTAARLDPWLRRSLYNLGRLVFYVLLGAIAGLGGAMLSKSSGVFFGLQALRLLAALLVIAIGLNLLFDWRLTRFLESAGARLWRHVSRLARYVLPASSPGRAFLAGMIWGALPCGLVYSAVAIAATTGTPPAGAAVMLAFGIGTAPAMLAVGASAERFGRLRGNKGLRRIAGLIVVLLGLAALAPFAKGSGDHAQHATLVEPRGLAPVYRITYSPQGLTRTITDRGKQHADQTPIP
ncbi:MAG: sulfite exporter TauE/SafE family protein [Gammaproteobacteria bacterium]|nr:sulfite exporter TauE/SafE family protein [Gammaproteobacteria bacterium]MDH5302663.1 sulfite exporter TauE/SafE family protein [Gammaproteobacteria bacterium]MDH5320900.1 sulfite exporter TauE/SafE family protein [Gammaproteobacteria bacterium]